MFEHYIITLFNTQFFYPKKWRESRLFTNSFLPVDHWNPDLEMELVFSNRKKYSFAVECKWRNDFNEGRIKWAKDHQILAYRKFQDQVRIPVFVAIGIGGTPDMPDKLFLTPLNSICMRNELHESDLIPYKRKPTWKFYYDVEQLMLF